MGRKLGAAVLTFTLFLPSVWVVASAFDHTARLALPEHLISPQALLIALLLGFGPFVVGWLRARTFSEVK